MEESRNNKLRYWLIICGILNAVFYLLHDCIGARFYPGYNWMAQAVSDLTATDAPSRLIASELTKIHGIFSCVACTLICISAIGYSLFPLTSSGYDTSFIGMPKEPVGLSSYDGKGISGKFKKHKFTVSENLTVNIPLKKL